MPPHPTETPATAYTVWRDADATLGTAGWLLWGATAVLTGVVAGVTVSHSLVLGRYFDWLVAGDDPAAFAAADPRSCARFRAERDPVTPYVAVCFAQLAVAAAFLAASVRARRRAPRLWRAAIAPALAMPLLVALHTATGFAAAERAVLGGAFAPGVTGAAARAVFLAWTGPVHALVALLFAAALGLLLRGPFLAPGAHSSRPAPPRAGTVSATRAAAS